MWRRTLNTWMPLRFTLMVILQGLSYTLKHQVFCTKVKRKTNQAKKLENLNSGFKILDLVAILTLDQQLKLPIFKIH